MHRRQQTDSTNTKLNYQVTSPYIELLESRKKVYGHKYENKTNKSFMNKSKQSTDKSKKKKRNHTENIEDKMHQSLYVEMNEKEKPQYNASKSLFYAPQEKNPYFQFLSQTGKKTRKRYLSQKKYTTDIFKKTQSNLQNLKIQDIDSLIALIDNCVAEANQYITYLSSKIQTLKQQLIVCKASQNELQIALNIQEGKVAEKDRKIVELEKKRDELPFEMKNLLEVIEKINAENIELKKKLELQDKPKQKSKELYNEIHNSIDILNISIRNKKEESPARKEMNKKLKFIKYKHK